MAGSAVVGTLRALLTLDTAEYEKGTARVSKQTDAWTKQVTSMGKQATSAGKTLTAAITLPLLGLGAAALKAGQDFGKSMNAIEGVLQPTAAQMEKIRATAIEMGAATAFSATDAADAMLELGKAGFDTDTAIASVDEVLQLAAASGLGMADAASLAARTLTSFGMEAGKLGHVNDVLAQAVNSTTLEIGDMQTAFGYVGPIATGFGMSLEQVSAALGIMRDNGIAAETTGRALREGFTRLVNPTKAVRDVMTELGIETFKTADGGMMDLSEIVGVLEAKGISTGQAMKMFGDAAGPGMAALIRKGQGSLDTLTKELENSEGAAKKMADSMMKGLPGAMERLRGSTETAFLAISQAIEPTTIRVMDKLGSLADLVTTSVVPGFMRMSPAGQTAALGITAMAAAAGPALIVAGKLIESWGNVSKALGITFTGSVAMAMRSLTVLGGVSLREWFGNATNAQGSTRALNEELDALGSHASTWDKVRVVMRNWDTATAGATTTAALLGRTFRQTAGDINLTAGATATAAQRSAEAKKAFAEQLADLALRIGNMRDSGASASAVLESMGVEAKIAADGAKQLGIDTAAVPQSVTELAGAFQRQTDAAKGAASATVDVSEADKLATQAAEDATQAMEAKRNTLRSLGKVTQQEAIQAITEYNEALELAANDGSKAFSSAASAVIQKLVELRAKLIDSGQSTAYVDAELLSLRDTVVQLNGAFPHLSATISTTMQHATGLASGVRTVTGAQMAAETQTYLTTRAFQHFGLTTREEYERTVREARTNLQYLLESEEATAEQIAEARAQVVEAERRGRKESISIWREYGRDVVAIGRNAANGLARALLGMNGSIAEENQRLAEDARENYDRTQEQAADTLVRGQQQARSEYDRTAGHVEGTYQRELTAADDKYADLLEKAGDDVQARKTLENWYANERQRIEDEKNAGILAAQVVMDDAIATDVKATNAEIEAAHAEMQAAIEQASHPFRDNMIEVWGEIKDAFAQTISDMLGDFITRFIGGTINALLGNRNAYGSAFAGMFGSGAAGAGASGAGAGAGAGTGVGAGISLGAVLPWVSVAPIAIPWAGALLGPHFTDQPTAEDPNQYDNYADYFNGLQSFETGTNGRYVDFGAESLVKLHGREKITPMGSGGEQATFVFEFDGQTFARMQAPYLVGEVRRLQLGR